MDEVLHWSTELVTNSSLRWQLREKGLKLAESYSLERLSQRLALILAQVMDEKDWHHWYPVEACWGYSDAQSVAWHRAELECQAQFQNKWSQLATICSSNLSSAKTLLHQCYIIASGHQVTQEYLKMASSAWKTHCAHNNNVVLVIFEYQKQTPRD